MLSPLSADSAVGSNGYGSRNLEDVEEADIEAGQILTALKSSPSPIRSTLLQLIIMIVIIITIIIMMMMMMMIMTITLSSS